MSLLVVSATPEEARHVPTDYDLLITGIGKVPAAAAVAAALARNPGISEIVNIGSAGALRDGLAGIFPVKRVWNHDLSSEALRSFGHDPNEWLDLGIDEGVSVATGDLFVADPAVRQRLGLQAELVDMEGYAIAWAARQAGVTCTMVKHVSDSADESALEWAQVVDLSAQALAGWLAAHRPLPVQ